MSNERYPFLYSQSADTSALSFPLTGNGFENLSEAEPHTRDAKLLYITTARYGKDWNSMVHSHTFSEIFFVTKGSGRLRCGKSTLPLLQNDLVVINPNTDHAEFSQEEDPLQYIVLGIDGIIFSASYGQNTSDALYFLREAQSIGAYMRLLLDEVQTKAADYESVCRNLIHIIISLLHRQQNVTISSYSPSYLLPFCATVKDYIDRHFKEDLDLAALAKVAGQNKYYLVHAFSETYGMSPMKYLMKRKIDEALCLLSDTTLPIYVISGILGFSSSSHFAQAFRKVTNETPNSYRKKFRKVP